MNPKKKPRSSGCLLALRFATVKSMLEEIQDQLHRMEAAQTRMDVILLKLLQDKTKREGEAEKRRFAYKNAKELRVRGKLKLPDNHILERRDARLADKIAGWAEAGMRFGALDKPEQFLTWLCYQWNGSVYLKKPITFSGSSFRVWGSHIRFSYGPRDLMGFAERRGSLQILSLIHI